MSMPSFDLHARIQAISAIFSTDIRVLVERILSFCCGDESLETHISVSVNMPSTENFLSDSNGSLTGEAERVFEYEHENHLTNVYVSETWRGEFKYNALRRRRASKESNAEIE